MLPIGPRAWMPLHHPHTIARAVFRQVTNSVESVSQLLCPGRARSGTLQPHFPAFLAGRFRVRFGGCEFYQASSLRARCT